jgi:hypothetical protein
VAQPDPTGRVLLVICRYEHMSRIGPRLNHVPEEAAVLSGTELEPRLGLVGDVADEIRWTFTKRLGWIGQILLNLAIGLPIVFAMAWNSHRDGVRVSGFATSIAGWVLASALNTNQLGFDADRAAASFRSGDTAWRVLFLKNLSVFVVLTPPILLLSTILRLTVAHPPDAIPIALIRDVADITVWLGFGSLLSVLLPFRPLGIRGRWETPSSWVRFAVCVGAPYAVYYALLKSWHVPELAVADRLFHHARHHVLAYSLTLLVWGFVTWSLGLVLAEVYYQCWPKKLEDDLDRRR